MGLRSYLFLVAYIIINFVSAHPALAMSSDGELDRVDENNKIVARYVDNLRVGNCRHSLNFPIDKELAKKAYRISTWDHQNSPSRKSHVLVNGFDIYENDSGFVCEYDPFTTKTFHNVGIGEKDTDIRIDWMSFESQLESTYTIVRRKSNGTGNGHSEPQLIADIEALWQTQPDSLLKLFVPRANTLENSTVIMCGLELYGSFDMCDSCFPKLIDFRKRHQSGNSSISYAIRDKLKDKYTGIKENGFVVIYHTCDPYAGVSYHTTHNGADYTLGYAPTCKSVYNAAKKRMEYPKFPALMVKYAGEPLEEDPALTNTTLFQAKKAVVEKDIIYGQLHRLHGKVASYKKPDMGTGSRFIFDNE